MSGFNPYRMRTVEYIKVPVTKDTELSFYELFQANNLGQSREGIADPRSLENNERETYLDSIREELQLRGSIMKNQIFEIGKLLLQARKALPHGAFQSWVENNFDHSYKTALNCIRVYKKCMGTPEAVSYFPASCLYIMCAPNFPEILRERMFEGVTGPVDIKKKDVIELLAKFRDGEIGLGSPEIQKLLRKQKARDYDETCRVEVEAILQIIEDRIARVEGILSHLPQYPLLRKPKELDEDMESSERMPDRYGVIRKLEEFAQQMRDVLQEIDEKGKRETVT